MNQSSLQDDSGLDSGTSLLKKTVGGASIMLSAQAVKLLLSIGSTAILARLLSPEDYGLIAMVGTFMFLINVVQGPAFSTAVVQANRITQEQLSNLFWITVIACVAMAAVTVFVSPLVSWIYDEKRLTGIMIWLSLSYLFSGLSLQHLALLKRRMKFVSIAIIQIVSLVLGYVIGIVTAHFNWEYWSLVAMQVATPLAQTILAWLLCPWRPGRYRKTSGVGELVRFGGNFGAYAILRVISESIAQVIVGVAHGATPAGLYNQSNKLANMPLMQILRPMNSVAVPILSRLQDSQVNYRKYYLKILEINCLLLFYIGCMTVTCSDWIVMLLLGPKWTDAIPILSVFGIIAFVYPVLESVRWLFISQGHTRVLRNFGLIEGAISLCSIFTGLYWGVLGIVSAFVVSGLLIKIPVAFYMAAKVGPINQRGFYKILIPQILLSAISIAILWWIKMYFDTATPVVGQFLFVIISLIAYSALLFLSPSTRSSAKELSDILFSVNKTRRLGT